MDNHHAGSFFKTDLGARARLPTQVHGRLYAFTYAHKNLMSTAHTLRRTNPSLPGKRATNLSLSSDLLDAAKQLGINISQVCDSHLREVVRLEQERKWREEHADFITAYNATVDTEGLPLDEWKSF